jgi:hypothetical protein
VNEAGGRRFSKYKNMDYDASNYGNNKSCRTSIIFGVIYGFVAAGFYVTPIMLLLLGTASLSTAVAMQGILIKNLGWAFVSLGLLLALITVMIYLRRKNVKKLTMAEIKPYRAFIGGISTALLVTYAVLATIALFTLSK